VLYQHRDKAVIQIAMLVLRMQITHKETVSVTLKWSQNTGMKYYTKLPGYFLLGHSNSKTIHRIPR